MNKLVIELPPWLEKELLTDSYEKLDDRVKLVLGLAKRNFIEKTGGPFAAVIFNRKTWNPVAIGTNLVFQSKLSTAHAEIIAISIAQKKFNNFDLSNKDLELVSSCEPCAMCTGALLWSGIKGLVYSATKNNAEEIGFDEGDKPKDWKEGYRTRGIYIFENILQEKGRKVLLEYAEDGVIYNPRSG